MPLAEVRGGAEASLLHFLKGVSPELRNRVHVCFLQHGPLAEKSALSGFPTTVIESGRLRHPPAWLRCVLSLRRWLRAARCELVLSWMTKAHLYAGPAALLAGIPAAWWQHGLAANRGVDLLATLVRARGILTCSLAAAHAQRRVWLNRVEPRTIYPPVDLSVLRTVQDRDSARRRLTLPSDKVVIGMVARLQRWKGVHVFLAAARALVDDIDDLYFVVVGGPHSLEPDYAAYVEQCADELQLRSHLRLAGHQDDAAEWIAAMDIVASPSLGEPFGMVILEAMALGKPVVATRAAGPLEIIEDGENGLLVEPGSASELAGALRSLATEPALRVRLAAAATERLARYDVPRFVGEVLASMSEMHAEAQVGVRTASARPPGTGPLLERRSGSRTCAPR